MSQPIIEVRNLAKRYRLGAIGATSLREELGRRWDRLCGRPHPDAKEFWALRDVSFDIHPGEVVGVIGRNGAGKSTLLKILSRITEPTGGTARLRGRVASLLEVGTGFHPELTGRENVFLNGAILGMTRAEVRRKFDEIVAFAEVEQFIDTPVKRYSSGMYVRLAFAVAAHLEPEILIVDEVLAVGDSEFQKKCLGKMKSVAQDSGRTVLFVSHNMTAIQKLCGQCLMLKQGRVELHGSPSMIISHYLAHGPKAAGDVDLQTLPAESRRGSGKARFTHLHLKNKDGKTCAEFQLGEPLVVSLIVRSEYAVREATIGVSFVSEDGTEIMGTSAEDSLGQSPLSQGEQLFSCNIAPLLLLPGRYFLRGAVFSSGELYDHIDEMTAFDVVGPAKPEVGPRHHAVGFIYAPYVWTRH